MATPRTLTLLNPQTGETQIVPVVNRTIPATAFSKFKIDQTTPSPLEQGDTVPIRLYDPGFKNTAVCKSKISFVDGETGKLYYRGYDVEELVERSSYLEVSFLLIFGELPDQAALKEWTYNVMHHTFVHAQLERQMAVLRYDSHPMAMLIASIASLSTFHPEANPALAGDTMYMKPRPAPGTAPSEDDAATSNNAEKHRNRAIYRMLGKIPTIASHAYRHRQGRPFNTPMNSNNYCENLLYMMDNLNQADYKPNPTLVGILDKLFILLAGKWGLCRAWYQLLNINDAAFSFVRR